MIRWFAGHPTASNLLLLLILAMGLFSAPTLLRETFPDFRAVEAEITVVYRGAAARDVEDAICRPLWDALQPVEGLAELSCQAQDNRARAVATLAAGGNALRFVNDIRTEVGAIDSFPARADPAVVRCYFLGSSATSTTSAGSSGVVTGCGASAWSAIASSGDAPAASSATAVGRGAGVGV